MAPGLYISRAALHRFWALCISLRPLGFSNPITFVGAGVVNLGPIYLPLYHNLYRRLQGYSGYYMDVC